MRDGFVEVERAQLDEVSLRGGRWGEGSAISANRSILPEVLAFARMTDLYRGNRRIAGCELQVRAHGDSFHEWKQSRGPGKSRHPACCA